MSNYYAILHDRDPGQYHHENILSAKHADVFPHADLTPDAIVVKINMLTFEAVRSVPFGPRPVWVTIWDGPNYLLTVQVNVGTHINKGDIVDINLDWTMQHSEARPR